MGVKRFLCKEMQAHAFGFLKTLPLRFDKQGLGKAWLILLKESKK